MTAEEIFAGESENIEFKSEIPAKSEKYMKTVVAFANGKGGKLVFGVENGTWTVTGFSKEEVFQKMDAITNAIFDSCEPKITPSIAVQEIDGKAVIVVEIIPGMQRPYYIKSQGIMDGTYIRVAGTTRHAERYRVQELIMEGTNRSLTRWSASRRYLRKRLLLSARRCTSTPSSWPRQIRHGSKFRSWQKSVAFLEAAGGARRSLPPHQRVSAAERRHG